MKKLLSWLFVVSLSFSLTAFIAPTQVSAEEVVLTSNAVTAPESLILNSDGSYGGSINEALYGKGAPKNGEFDVTNSQYFLENDFYNMNSTDEDYPLTLLPKFKSYQQTMQDSSAFACLVMVFNDLGLDITDEYSELSLLNKYQTHFNTTVYNNGLSVDDYNLSAFINSLNLGFTAEARKIDNFTGAGDYIKNEVIKNLKEGNYILVRYMSASNFQWKVIIGWEQMGTDYLHDDVIIFADPFDSTDHHQTGYSHVRAEMFSKWWKYNDYKLNLSNFNQSVIIKAGKTRVFTESVRNTAPQQTLHDLHFILNADGSYGGTRDASKYGTITTKNGSRNRTFTTYYKINDYYNLGDENTRLLLKNYVTFQQTMAYSCGMCSTISALKYYGEPITEADEVNFLNYYQQVTGFNPNTGGTQIIPLYETLKARGYNVEVGISYKNEESHFPTYYEYRSFLKENLSKDRPIVFKMANNGGHLAVVIGFDDMGTDYMYDDVVIVADSSDYWDHYQDGYCTWSANQLYNVFTDDDYKYNHAYVVFYPKEESSNALWLILGIVGGVVVLGGATVATIIVIKKKKAKKAE